MVKYQAQCAVMIIQVNEYIFKESKSANFIFFHSFIHSFIKEMQGMAHDVVMTSMRHNGVTSTSVRRHVPAK